MASDVHLNKFDAVYFIAALKWFIVDSVSQYSCCVDSWDREIHCCFYFIATSLGMFKHKEIVHNVLISLEHSHLRIRHAAILYTMDSILYGDNNNNNETTITITMKQQ